MVTKIKWNKTAIQTFNGIAEYLEINYSGQSAFSFVANVYKRIDHVAKGLAVGRYSTKAKTVIILKIGKHRQMFYRLAGSTLIIVDFWDTRQDPQKKRY